MQKKQCKLYANVMRVCDAIRPQRTDARMESVGNRGFLVTATANPFIDRTSVQWTPTGSPNRPANAA
ncbi:hypothetical protein M513_11323 [Trichuris suis]|uniref:Uncharacterized protein n=1 Tax=Trichuris suis TaxID=68888 RepID=A0A085LS27_9BILA|nr:hypothetical protein M513_11323 [Trichuris suis]